MGALEGVDTGDIIWMLAVGLLLVFMVPALLVGYRGRFRVALTHAAVWLALFVALIAAYAYRDIFQDIAARVGAELTPAGRGLAIAAPDGERAVRIRRSARGPFVALASVNGIEFSMLVDTGAASVVLKPADAERAGIDIKSLSFTIPVDTANGSTFCAPVRLRSIAVGGIGFQNVEALVAQPGNLKESLLGMTFLKRLRSYEFSGDFLTLRS